MDEVRYSRNIALFGEEGQKRIAATVVTIVGLGGLGSHVAQQLAYLGILHYGLIDHDVLTESSLNRVVGSVPSDVEAKTPKVRSAERMIKLIQPQAAVAVEQARITSSNDDPVAALIRRSDVVFGCLDAESPRLFLTDVCSSFGLAYFDLATDTGGEDDDWYGGRVLCCTGSGCLLCLDLLDQRQIRLEQMTDAEHANEQRLYGLNRAMVGQTGPAVVSINGIIASMGVTEFMAHVTRIREPAAQLTYRGDIPRVTLSKDVPRDGCPYCAAWKRSVTPR